MTLPANSHYGGLRTREVRVHRRPIRGLRPAFAAFFRACHFLPTTIRRGLLDYAIFFQYLSSSKPTTMRPFVCRMLGPSGLRALSVLLLLSALSWLSLDSYSPTGHYGTVIPKPSLRNEKNTLNRQPTPESPVRSHSFENHEEPTLLSPPPLQVWRSYIQQHGQAALESDMAHERTQRKYLVAPYWCPDRAGNVLHNLFNSVTWAFLLNRTLLLRWVPENPNGNTHEACQSLLPTSPDIPLFERWQDRLDIEEADITSISLDPTRLHFDETLTVVIVPQIPDVYYTRPKDFYRNGWNDHPLAPNKPAYREYLQVLWHKDMVQQKQAVQLLGYGIAFWYGLLFRHMFSLPSAVRRVSSGPATVDTAPSSGSEQFSFALHSRHVAHSDDGSWVPDETECLAGILEEHGLLARKKNQSSPTTTTTTTPCTIYLLSDRRATLSVLTEWVHQRAPTCNVVTTRHDQPDTTRVVEHGPFAGAGFLQDLSMVTDGRGAMTALVGDLHRSSFALLYELVVFDTFSNNPNTTLDIEDVGIPVCTLPTRTARGYSYGEGSPFFVRDPQHFPTMEPLKVLQQYQERESFDNFAVVQARCPWDEDYAKFLAAVLFGVLTDRLLLWTPSSGQSNCIIPEWLPQFNSITAKMYDLKLEDAMEMQRHGANEARLVELSNKTLSLFEHAFSRGNFLRPKEGGGRRKTAEALYTYGPKFLMGALFQHVYEYKPPRGPTLEKTAWTVGVDGRTEPTMEKVKSCLGNTMVNRTTEECQVVLVISRHSDRSTQLQQDIQNAFNCSVLVVPTATQAERALMVAGQVRNGWLAAVETDATATRIRANIEWERIQSRWNLGKFPIDVPPFVDCAMS